MNNLKFQQGGSSSSERAEKQAKKDALARFRKSLEETHGLKGYLPDKLNINRRDNHIRIGTQKKQKALKNIEKVAKQLAKNANWVKGLETYGLPSNTLKYKKKPADLDKYLQGLKNKYEFTQKIKELAEKKGDKADIFMKSMAMPKGKISPSKFNGKIAAAEKKYAQQLRKQEASNIKKILEDKMVDAGGKKEYIKGKAFDDFINESRREKVWAAAIKRMQTSLTKKTTKGKLDDWVRSAERVLQARGIVMSRKNIATKGKKSKKEVINAVLKKARTRSGKTTRDSKKKALVENMAEAYGLDKRCIAIKPACLDKWAGREDLYSGKNINYGSYNSPRHSPHASSPKSVKEFLAQFIGKPLITSSRSRPSSPSRPRKPPGSF